MAPKKQLAPGVIAFLVIGGGVAVALVIWGIATLVLRRYSARMTNGHRWIDPATSAPTRSKYDKEGLELAFSDEFRDPQRTWSFFTIDEFGPGVAGITKPGTANVYTKSAATVDPSIGLRLQGSLTPASAAKFKEGIKAGTAFGTPPLQWDWTSGRVSTREHARFQYGRVEFDARMPKNWGVWPALWMNFSYGTFASDGTPYLQKDYPFLNGQYWPPEIDVEEMWSPEHYWKERPNQMSVHSPSQFTGPGTLDPVTQQIQGVPTCGHCPTTSAKPGAGYCFGVSTFAPQVKDPTDNYVTYAVEWDAVSVTFYQEGNKVGRFTKDQLVLYRSGQLRPINIPQSPLYLIMNLALVPQGAAPGSGDPGLTDKSNFDASGNFKPCFLDIRSVRVYQRKADYPEKGLNPPITEQTKLHILDRKVTCGILPYTRSWLDPVIPGVFSKDTDFQPVLDAVCHRLTQLGDDYCTQIDFNCKIHNAAIPTVTKWEASGPVQVSHAVWYKTNLGLQQLGIMHGEGVKVTKGADGKLSIAFEKDPSKYGLPDSKWLTESVYFKQVRQPTPGVGTMTSGNDPVSWRTRGTAYVPGLT